MGLSQTNKRTRVVECGNTSVASWLGDHLLPWILNPDKPRHLYHTYSDVSHLISQFDGETWDHEDGSEHRFHIVDGIFETPWVNFGNTNQVCFVHEQTRTYFIIRTHLPDNTLHKGVDEYWGWEDGKAKGMVVTRCKLNPKAPPHDSLEGELKRLCFDLRGSMIWLSNPALRTGGVYFPDRWGSFQDSNFEKEFESRKARPLSQGNYKWNEEV